MSETVWMAESGMVHIDHVDRMRPIIAMVLRKDGLEFDGHGETRVDVVVMNDGKLEVVRDGRIAYPGSKSPEWQYACATNGVPFPRTARGSEQRSEQRTDAQRERDLLKARVRLGEIDRERREKDRRDPGRVKFTNHPPTYEDMQREAREKGSGELTQPQEAVPPKDE